MFNRGEPIVDVELWAKFFELWVVELLPYDNGLGQFKLVDNRLLDEVSDLLVSNWCKWFSFDPFRKVVDHNNKEFSLSGCLQKKIEDIDSPLCKRRRCKDRCELYCRLALNIGISLALIASPNKFNGILLQDRPIVSLSEYFVCQ